MSRTSYSFPPKDYVKKVVDPAKVPNQEKLSQLIVIKPDRKNPQGSKKRKAVDSKDDAETSPPKDLTADPKTPAPKRAEQSASAPLTPSQRQSEDKRMAVDAPLVNGNLPSHSRNEEPNLDGENLERGDSKSKQSETGVHASILDADAEERRLNDIEIGNREDSGRWWLRKPKPRELEGNAETKNADEESRVVVWAEPRLLQKANVLAMPYVTYLD